ncbi:MAG TPA: alpha-2-macroglobulin family protein, partial [Chitinophagaceae bacterium]|nr:alpha-2-macroglobulin family protein [Chitinophagaceae bacterium]
MRVVFAILLLAGVISVSAQTNRAPYADQWTLVDSLLHKKGLTRSALQVIQQIYITAKQDRNETQMIAALLHRLALEENLEESGFAKQFAPLEQELQTVTGPVKSILHSILAQRYWLYYQMRRRYVYDRSNTINTNKDDIDTWGREDFLSAITRHYLLSLHDKKLLQQTKTSAAEPLIIYGNVSHLRPTLFDILAHRALDYFTNDEYYLSDFSEANNITQPEAFAEAAVFAAHRFRINDSSARIQMALPILQELIAFHLNDGKPDALIDADIRRLDFVRRKSTLENKDSLFISAMYTIVHRYPLATEASTAWYHIAKMHMENAGQEDPSISTYYRYGYVTAREICERIVSSPDSSEGKYKCAVLLQQIVEKKLSMEAEKVNSPYIPFRVLLRYRNIDQLHFRLIKLTPAIQKQIDDVHREGYWERLTGLQPLKTFTQALPGSADHRPHAAEMKMDALSPGEYLLLASNDKLFNPKDSELSIQSFYVSGIAYIYNGHDVFVLDRETGQPLKNASVQVWQGRSDYYNWLPIKGPLLKTDANGHCRVIKTADREIRLEISTASDHLFVQEEENLPFYEKPRREQRSEPVYEEVKRVTYFFTDRSIYRPGQTVYFKGISITTDFHTKKPKVVTGKKTKVFLFDVNDQAVDSLEVVTNEFGSFSGRFRLREHVLTGLFSIYEKGSASFSVEEYKRPKFSVAFEEVKGSYRVFDSINITGFARAYAGNNIDGASVKYRITRSVWSPYSWLNDDLPSGVEIMQGEVKTGADGKFHLRFPALPDRSVNKQYDPAFDYMVSVDVTDLNGETHSASTWVRASYKALIVSIKAPPTMPADSLKSIYVLTTNMAGQFEKAPVNVAIYRLNAPQRLIRERLWDRPDQYLMTKEEYLQYFPHDEYGDETNKEQWERLEKVYEGTDSTNATGNFALRSASGASQVFHPGWYVVEVSAYDKYGQPVKNTQYIQLAGREERTATPVYLWPYEERIVTAPGNTVVLEIGTSADSVFMIQCIDKPSEDNINRYSYSFSLLPAGRLLGHFGIQEHDRGNFNILHAFVKHNRVYTTSTHFVIPWSNKDLTVSYETFRDKTEPGSEEKWKVKISGHQKEKVAAEILTTLYDASLDQYKRHDWTKPHIWKDYQPQANWQLLSAFGSQLSINREWYYYKDRRTSVRFFHKDYDIIYSGIKVIKNYDGSFRHIMPYWESGHLIGKPRIMQVPDWNVDPDGSKGITKDTVIAEAAFRATSAGNESEDDRMIANKAIYSWPGPAENKKLENPPVQVRKNFNETAFFFPDLRTDSAGNVEFSFTMPEALTQWKWMLLSHTKDLSMGLEEKYIVTQKELMLQPNMPRFLREGDKMELNAKIANLGSNEVSGEVTLQLVNAADNQPLDNVFMNTQPVQRFTVAAGQSTLVKFPVTIPSQFTMPVAVRLIARSANVSDGEENSLPVLSDRILVTETLPLNLRGDSTRNFRLEKLASAQNNKTIVHQSLTLEFTPNPAWYAVQALPYLMEYPYECAEQLWNRVYANALGSTIAEASPRIKEVFAKWQTEDTAALLSSLQKNEELKSVLLQETPWVLQAKNEHEQKKNLSLLFNTIKMGSEISKNLNRLQQLQTSDGGFSWFGGGYSEWYITQYVVTGIGRLQRLGGLPEKHRPAINDIVRKALEYLDLRLKKDYDHLLKGKADLQREQINYLHINYLYMRSFFGSIPIDEKVMPAFDFYRKQAQQFWLQQGRYMQGMIALALFRTGDGKTATDILRSLKQNAIISDEL